MKSRLALYLAAAALGFLFSIAYAFRPL